MFIEGIGGVQYFGLEKQKDSKDSIRLIFRKLNGFKKEQQSVKVVLKNLQFEKGFKDLNKLYERDFNDKLKLFLPTLNVKIKNFIFEKNNTTELVLNFNENEYQLIFDWNKTKDLISIEAPYVNGEFNIDTRLENSVLNQYLEYFLNGKSENDLMISQTNILLFFESFDSQRSIHILTTIVGFVLAYSDIGEKIFEENLLVKKMTILDKEFTINIKAKLNKNLTSDFEVFIKGENFILNLINKDGTLNFTGIKDLYSLLIPDKKFVVSKFSGGTQTNKKGLLSKKNIFDQDNELYFSFSENNVKNYYLEGRGLILNPETLDILEFIMPHEYILSIIKSIFYTKLS